MKASEKLIMITKFPSCRYSLDRLVFVIDAYLDGQVTKDIYQFPPKDGQTPSQNIEIIQTSESLL